MEHMIIIFMVYLFLFFVNLAGIVGRISPKTWAAMDLFLASIANEDYEPMASALIEMGATDKNVDVKAFSRDLEKIFSSIQVHLSELSVAHVRTCIDTLKKRKRKKSVYVCMCPFSVLGHVCKCVCSCYGFDAGIKIS